MSARRLDATALRDWAHTRGRRPHRPHRRDQPTQRLPRRRRRYRHEHAVHHARGVRAGRLAPRPTTSSAVAAALAEGALQGARGNSGVILSQILRGLADVTAEAADERDGDLADVDGDGVRRRPAARGRPGRRVGGRDACPGTIVSVLQAAAGAAEDAADDGADLVAVVGSAAEAAAVALEKTPQQLDVLARAGVVDAGGRGLLVLLDAMTHRAGRAPAAAGRVPAHPPAPGDAVTDVVGGAAAVRGDVPARRVRPRGHRAVARAARASR